MGIWCLFVTGVWCSSLDAQRTCGSEKPLFMTILHPESVCYFSFLNHFSPLSHSQAHWDKQWGVAVVQPKRDASRLRIQKYFSWIFFLNGLMGVKRKKKKRERQHWHREHVQSLIRCTVTPVALSFYLTFSFSCSVRFALVLAHAWRVWWPGKTFSMIYCTCLKTTHFPGYAAYMQ